MSAAFDINAATSIEVLEYKKASEHGMTALKKKNYNEAFKHLKKASMLGNKTAQYFTAMMYMEGLGTEKDFSQAYLWLNVAAEVKEKKWRNLRDQLHNALTTDQRNSLKPHVEKYIKEYGEKTQEISCTKRAATGSQIKVMSCVKHLDTGSARL